MTKYHVINWPG